jgi:uncharacterized protein YijF (DUF1287 family)
MEAVLKRNTVCEDVYVRMPKSDMDFFQLFAKKMGWEFDKKQNLWEKFIQNSPKNVDLTDEEIMEEVRAVRYGKI